jgi:DNA mismatch repair protein MutS2
MEREIRLLEFDKIRAALAAETVSAMGREPAEDLSPATDLLSARRWQAETTEAVCLLTRFRIDLENVPDLRRVLVLASRGGLLAEQQLFGVFLLLQAVTRLKTFFRENSDFPHLGGLVGQMSVQIPLRERLRQTLDDEGNLRDEASPELARLRRAVKNGERELRERLERFVRNPAVQKYLQESLVTVRGDRLVVPVRQEYRTQVPGVVHDLSASGATLFIEPMWAVEASNTLAALRLKEKAERERILLQLTQWIGAEKDELLLTLNLYAELDFCLAKGRLSRKGGCVEPLLNDAGYLNLVDARHPLLTGGVVPVSLELGKAYQTLVITGPNTGGKTVALKTVGLFCLMAASGLHVPAAEGTELAVFPQVFADIGDEQSIEQSLSTFSGHLKNIIGIVDKMEPGALVLLDEVGAGTDPTEGAGLAMSLLDYLHSRQAVTVATTHYSQIKAFAYLREGMENASTEFDVATLRPTYQLLVGVPGQSNAFAIAARLGLKPEIIERGKAFLSAEEMRLEEVVADLAGSLKRQELALAGAEAGRREAELLVARLRREEEELRRRKEESLRKARVEALEIVAAARRETEQILKKMRKLAAMERPATEEELRQLAGSAAGLETALREQLQPLPAERTLTIAEIFPGMEVLVNTLGQRGTVTRIAPGSIQVQVGPMRLQVEPDSLSRVEPARQKEQPAVTGLALFARREVAGELSVRGLTLDEAIMQLDNYLDEAAVAGLPEVVLIHGKGTGKLRTGLREHLRNHPLVAGFRPGQAAEGGLGVTVVSMK